jgi:hypothetical protein
MHRRLAAILAADIAGYSRLMHEDEASTVRPLDGERGRHGDRAPSLKSSMALPRAGPHSGRSTVKVAPRCRPECSRLNIALDVIALPQSSHGPLRAAKTVGRRTCGSPQEPRALPTPEQKETPPVGEKSTEEVAASSPTWDTLEAFARQSMQQLLRRMLDEEVDGCWRAADTTARRGRWAGRLSQWFWEAAAAQPEQRDDHAPAAGVRGLSERFEIPYAETRTPSTEARSQARRTKGGHAEVGGRSSATGSGW